jgi:hypothetical protein
MTCSSETSVDFQRNTRCHIPEDTTLDETDVCETLYSLCSVILTYLNNSHFCFSIQKRVIIV